MGTEGAEGSIIFLAHREWEQVTQEGTGEDLATTVNTHYSLTPVSILRPTTGFRRVVTMVRCESCGKEVRCVAFSPARTRWRRYRRQAVGWATMALGLAGWGFTGFKVYAYHGAPVGGAMSFLLFMMVVAGIVLGAVGSVGVWSHRDDGISVRGGRLHSRRDAGETHEVSTHTSPPR